MLNRPPEKIRIEDLRNNKASIVSGGIGTGYAHINKFGSLDRFSINNNDSENFAPFVFFVIKAETEDNANIFVLDNSFIQNQHDISFLFSESDISFKILKCTESYVNYPFLKAVFSDDEFPGNVRLTAFSPFIPNNEYDSGIPSVLYDFSIENNTQNDIKYTVYAVYENSDYNTHNSFCTSRKDNIKYILFEDGIKSESNLYADLCIGAYGDSIECVENHNVLSSSLILKPCREGNARFAVSWYCPCFLNNDSILEKRYYTKYFSSASECTFYCLSQWDRIFNESNNFCNLLYSSSLNYEVLKNITNELQQLIVSHSIRNYSGTFENIDSTKYLGNLLTYFPKIFRGVVDESFDVCHTLEDKIILFDYLYGYFKTTGDIDFVERTYNSSIEDVIKHIIAGANVSTDFILKMIEIATAIKDKKRIEFLNGVLSKKTNDDSAKNHSITLDCIREACNFNIDVINRSYKFLPDMGYSEKGVFQCILCFGSFLGFVERGIDYIQIKSISGTLYIRNIELPCVPLKVKCGGFEIGFSRKENIAILDNDCEINPNRDLLVIIHS